MNHMQFFSSPRMVWLRYLSETESSWTSRVQQTNEFWQPLHRLQTHQRAPGGVIYWVNINQSEWHLVDVPATLPLTQNYRILNIHCLELVNCTDEKHIQNGIILPRNHHCSWGSNVRGFRGLLVFTNVCAHERNVTNRLPTKLHRDEPAKFW